MTTWTVDKLTHALNTLWMSPPNTGALSQLDKAAFEFADRSEAAQDAYAAFRKARYAHKDAHCRYEDETGPWERAVAAGQVLAQAIRDTENPR